MRLSSVQPAVLVAVLLAVLEGVLTGVGTGVEEITTVWICPASEWYREYGEQALRGGGTDAGRSSGWDLTGRAVLEIRKAVLQHIRSMVSL